MLGIEDILRDVRKDENWLDIQDKNEWDDNPSSRAGVYDKTAHNRLHDSRIDAERWPLAISSYKNYSCFSFSEDDVVARGKYYFSTTDYYMHYVKKNGENIRIQADLLTNYGTIHKLIDRFHPETDEEKNIVYAFDRIAYTIGAFCPIWKNPGGRAALKDTVWDKLLYSGLVDLEGRINKEKCIALEKRENEDNLLRRYKEKLFLIISDNQDPQSVVDSLYFQDYFSCKWELRYKFGSISELRNKDEVYRYIKDIIVLIVQRSYRIITKYQGHILREKDQKIIKKYFKQIGMNNVECIYSKKKSG